MARKKLPPPSLRRGEHSKNSPVELRMPRFPHGIAIGDYIQIGCVIEPINPAGET
jgi:hypothetical protein